MKTTTTTSMTIEKFQNTHKFKRFMKSLNNGKRANQRADILLKLLNSFGQPVPMVEIVINDGNVIPQYGARISELRRSGFMILSTHGESFLNRKKQLITPTYFTLVG